MRKSSLSMIYALISFLLLIGLFIIPLTFPAIIEIAPQLFFWSPAIASGAGVFALGQAIFDAEPKSHLFTALLVNLFCILLFGLILWTAYNAS